MRKFLRFLVTFLSPPFIGAIILIALGSSANAVPIIFMGAYIFGGIPSLFYAIIMEVAYFAGLKVGSPKSFMLSAFLGLLAGGSVYAYLAKVFQSPHFLMGYVMFGVIGAIVGVFCNLLSMMLSPPPLSPDNSRT